MADQESRAQVVAVRDGMAVADFGSSMTVQPRSMTELLEFSKVMANSGVMIRPQLRGNVGACVAVTMQAMRVGMDPFAFGNKVYFTKSKSGDETMAYESQLVHAIILSRAPLKDRPRITYTGDGQTRQCHIVGFAKGSDEPLTYDSPEIGKISVKNSPLWVGDPDQQLHYFSVRAWARRHFPDVIMGVYTPDEIEAHAEGWGPDNAREISPPRPSRGDYLEIEASRIPSPTVTAEEIAAQFDRNVVNALELVGLCASREALSNLLAEMNDDIQGDRRVQEAYEAKFSAFGVRTRGTSTAAETEAKVQQTATPEPTRTPSPTTVAPTQQAGLFATAKPPAGAKIPNTQNPDVILYEIGRRLDGAKSADDIDAIMEANIAAVDALRDKQKATYDAVHNAADRARKRVAG